jgi:hypothetical protein
LFPSCNIDLFWSSNSTLCCSTWQSRLLAWKKYGSNCPSFQVWKPFLVFEQAEEDKAEEDGSAFQDPVSLAEKTDEVNPSPQSSDDNAIIQMDPESSITLADDDGS